MVYCGRPSQACRQCRRRNIKCDKKRASCGQCTRAHLRCPGYNDPKAFVFKNQTTTTIQKLHQGRTILPALTPSVELRAKSLFISHHVFGGSNALDYMQIFFKDKANEPSLSAAIRAVSLAYYSNEFSCASALMQGRKEYSSALQLTNVALRSPENATKDTTLLTVLLLDLFEKLANKGPSPLEHETKHIDGALIIMKLRGHKQFHERVGRRMFLQLSSIIVLKCLRNQTEVPADLIALWDYSSQFMDTSDPRWVFSNLTIRMARNNAALRRGELSPVRIIESAKELDREALAILDISSKHSLEEIHPTKDEPKAIHHQYSEIYSSYSISQICTYFRAMRLTLNETIEQQCLVLILSRTPIANLDPVKEIEVCTSIIISLSMEICASVQRDIISPAPIQGYQNSTESTSSMPSLLKTVPQPNLPSTFTTRQISHARGYLVALHIVARSAICPFQLRMDILRYLGFMGNTLGIVEAFLIKDILERNEKHIPWYMYNILWSHSSGF